ncbi:hypothetical protein L207DRAFT_633063 [Hyaloscypha variabilis F]|uniref:Uncharacterized protein n=1 Tax=Hyaloscypha variabilis (strain UAMH 11265 / GT02V1 / F) TaxID=1149755 RepID=A0A2J6RT82_HYAVF|nr:hypothetical protein L207DRAFT_633063 [Hyaloscypha variabilis F]
MLDTNTLCSDKDDSVPDRANSTASNPSEIQFLEDYYFDEDLESIEDLGGVWRRHEVVTQWDEWCNLKYPGTKENYWKEIASAAGEDVDIRLLIKGHPVPGYAIMLFLEACYAVDKVLCGMDMEAFAKVKEWHVPQEMKAYKYLLSDEMKKWWAARLAELESEIKSPFSSRVSLSWRIADLSRCVATLEVVMDLKQGIGTNIWTAMGETNGSIPPGGLHEAIYGRVSNLTTSVEILRKSLERIEQRDSESNPFAGHKSVELGGLRKRIPRAISPPINEHGIEADQTSTVNEGSATPTSGVTSPTRIDSPPGAKLPTTGLYYLQSIFRLAMSHFQISMKQYKDNGLLAWFVHKETAIFVSISFVIMSSFFMAWSFFLAKQQPKTSYEQSLISDPIFLGNLSQSILSNLSIYLIIATTIHNPPEGVRYRSWFWVWLFVSSLSSVLGLCLYSSMPLASIVFLWTAAFAQVAIPVLLVLKTGSSEAGSKDDVERYGD